MEDDAPALDPTQLSELQGRSKRYVELTEQIEQLNAQKTEIIEALKPLTEERKELEDPIKFAMVGADIGVIEVRNSEIRVSKRRTARAPTKAVLQDRVRDMCRTRMQVSDDAQVESVVETLWEKMEPEEKVLLQCKRKRADD